LLNKKNKDRKAFSLIELLIVIVIMGVIYTMAIGKFQSMGKGDIKVTLQNLKEYLRTVPDKYKIDEYETVRFLCLDNCSSCDVLVNNKKVTEDDLFDGFLDSTLKIYRYDYASGLVNVTQKVYFNTEDVEEDVCFSYEINKNGVGDQVILEYKKKIYDYSSYFTDTPVYTSTQEYIDFKENIVEEVIR